MTEQVAEHTVKIGKNVVVPVTNDGNTLLVQPRSSSIVQLLSQLSMLAAINFDRQTQLRAVEINGVCTDRMLLSET